MTISRYDTRKLLTNASELYSELIQVRNVRFINQFDTAEFSKDSFEKSKNFIYSYHVWAKGDRLYKLAHEHYGDSQLWWVLALVNQKPTEGHFQNGDLVMIPQPLNKVLEAFNI
jgi:hypothetical protein